METIKAILNRRSIRKYESKAVKEETIELLLKSAMYAPSARDNKAWHFIVIRNREILDAITTVHPYAQMLKEAPLAILVCGDKKIEETEAYIIQNCSAATQNLLLSAYDQGLGTVWLGIYPREPRIEGLKKLLNLPENILPVSLVAVGYPAETVEFPDRFKTELIHYDKW